MAILTRSPTSPMSGPLPATPPHAIRTGSWLAREARTKVSRLKRCVAVLYVAVVAQALVPFFALAAHRYHSRPSAAHVERQRPVPYPNLALPLQINGSQYLPLA